MEKIAEKTLFKGGEGAAGARPQTNPQNKHRAVGMIWEWGRASWATGRGGGPKSTG